MCVESARLPARLRRRARRALGPLGMTTSGQLAAAGGRRSRACSRWAGADIVSQYAWRDSALVLYCGTGFGGRLRACDAWLVWPAGPACTFGRPLPDDYGPSLVLSADRPALRAWRAATWPRPSGAASASLRRPCGQARQNRTSTTQRLVRILLKMDGQEGRQAAKLA